MRSLPRHAESNRAHVALSVVLIALVAALLGACGTAEDNSKAADGGTADTGNDDCSSHTPGSKCINPIRFDFDAGQVDIVGDLKKKDIDFEVPAPNDGFQITTQGVRLASGEDDEWCEAFAVPEVPNGANDDEWCITRFEIAMTKGYHHIFVSKAPIGSASEGLMKVGERERCVGGAHVVYGTDLLPIPMPQGEYVDVPYYPGIGEKFTPGQKISINYHYLNVSDGDEIAVTKLNFHAAPCKGLKEMQQFGFYNQDISIPPDGTYSTEMSGTFTQDAYVLNLFRHTHRLGTDVPVSFYKGAKDGQNFFTSHDYETDANFAFPEPTLVHKGEGFKFTCNYKNTRNTYVHFGPTADDEMCMLLGTWWTVEPDEIPTAQHRYKWTDDQ